MTPHAKLGIDGIIIGFILLFIVPWPIALALIVLAIAVPAGAWLMLDESQRRRYRELRRRQRGQIRWGQIRAGPRSARRGAVGVGRPRAAHVPLGQAGMTAVRRVLH